MLHLAPAALSDIRSAAQAGLTVTTHERRIHVDGYTGEGYIILDSHGNGAYMINGGMYGGWIETGISVTLDVISLIKPFAKLSPILTGILSVLTGIISNLEDLARCWRNGGVMNMVNLVVYVLFLVMFITYMTALLIMTGPGIGLVLYTLFSADMELIYGDMLSGAAGMCE